MGADVGQLPAGAAPDLSGFGWRRTASRSTKKAGVVTGLFPMLRLAQRAMVLRAILPTSGSIPL